MALSYVPPGVLPVKEIQASPQASNVASQIVPIIIAEAEGYQTYSENKTLTGTAAVNLTKKGLVTSPNGTALLNLAVTVVNPSNFETISPANFVVQKVSAGTAVGDETYSIKRAPIPGTPTLTTGAGSTIPRATYRYAVSYLVNIDTSGIGTTIYETGLGAIGTVTTGSAVGTVVVSDLGTASPAGITALGKNVYRSVNEGTNDNPNWSPWYKITSGTSASLGIGTAIINDTTNDISANQVAPYGIASGDTITVQYNYTDVNYWEPTIFSDFNDITDKYGEAFTATGTINSPASFAAKLAILNGAGNVIVAAIPSGGEATNSNWEDALLRLEDDMDGNVLVPITGRTTVHSLVNAHITKMKQRNVWKSAILGMDGSGTATVLPETLRATAQSYNDQDLCLVSPSRFTYFNSYLNTEVPVGGQYAAACLAGMHGSRTLAESLTRKQIAGLSSVGETRTMVGKNQDAQAGLVVIEQIPSTGSIRVRHEITTAPSDINTREYPVTLQRNNMINIVTQEIDRTIIGQIFADASAPSKVSTRVGQILDNLVNTGNLGSYTGLSAKVNAADPTVVDVRWQYKPVYTVQYVQISFGINLTSGGISAAGGINLVL